MFYIMQSGLIGRDMSKYKITCIISQFDIVSLVFIVLLYLNELIKKLTKLT